MPSLRAHRQRRWAPRIFGALLLASGACSWRPPVDSDETVASRAAGQFPGGDAATGTRAAPSPLLPALSPEVSGDVKGHPATLADATGRPPNVLLVTVDTLRADHLEPYGYSRPISPEIDDLAAAGVLFTDAITTAPTTAPALASVLTGRHIDTHGVRDNHSALPDGLHTLGEAFAAAGYDTAGFYGNGAVRDGFGQGLGRFEPFGSNWFFRDAAGTDKAIAWLRSAHEPWFLWIHYMDPHGPYRSSPPERSANLRYPETPELLRELPFGPGNYAIDAIPKYQRLGDQTRVVDYLRRYDGEILGTDAEIGRLRTEIEGSGQRGRTLVVFTADHGESLGEDGYFFQHGHLLGEGSVRVPLILSHPRLPQGLRVDAGASLLDVFPTLASLVGVELPEGSEGRDLGPEIEAAREVPLLAGWARALRSAFGQSGAESASGETGGVAPGSTVPRLAYTVTAGRLVSIRRSGFELQGAWSPGEGGGRLQDPVLLDHGMVPPRRVPPDKHAEVYSLLTDELTVFARQLYPPPIRATPAVRPTEAEDERRLRALGYLD